MVPSIARQSVILKCNMQKIRDAWKLRIFLCCGIDEKIIQHRDPDRYGTGTDSGSDSADAG